MRLPGNRQSDLPTRATIGVVLVFMGRRFERDYKRWVRIGNALKSWRSLQIKPPSLNWRASALSAPKIVWDTTPRVPPGDPFAWGENEGEGHGSTINKRCHRI